MFLADCSKLLAKIQTAVGLRDGQLLSFAAHTLKGPIGFFKDMTAFEAAWRIDRDTDREVVETARDVLAAEVQRVCESLGYLLNPSESR